jgi:hypothetical protein
MTATIPKLSFPSFRPDTDEGEPMLWAIQQQLLGHAEVLFGARNQSKKIYQPIFREDGPIVINTPTLDGAFAALSIGAGGYWPTVVYELAHETIHLLDPITGNTNWLEEGAAVLFSVQMSKAMTTHPQQPKPGSAYEEALSLLEVLPDPIPNSITTIRKKVGALSAVTSEALRELFPSLPEEASNQLSDRCIPR